MANVAFKRGLASALEAESFTAADGVFYLTTDTHRLYVGQDSNLIELNRYVRVVDKSTDLPEKPAKDDFAFVTEGSMLLVCKDPAAQGLSRWTQINQPDTDTDTTISLKSDPVVTSDDSGVSVTITFGQVEKNKRTDATVEKADIPVTFKIKSSDIATANNIAVAIGSTAGTGSSTIAVSGAGSAESSVTLKQGPNVTVADDGKNNITISATDTTYTLGAGANGIALTDSNDSPAGAIPVAGDGTYITATVDAENGLKVSHTTYAELKPTPGEDELLVHGKDFTVVTGVSRDTGGHITGYATKKYTLPADNDTYITNASLSAAANGNLNLALTDNKDTPISATTADEDGNGPLYMLVGKNKTKIFNQGTLDVYTTSEIDEKINGINAMVYRGTVGGDSATVKDLPTSGVAIGDTYKVAQIGTYGTHNCDVGDLLIATGTEVDGIISDTITWTYVPSGDETDTQYTFTNGGTNNATLNLTVKGASEPTGSVTFEGGTAITLAGEAGKITINHGDVSTTPSDGEAVSGYGGTFNAITGLTVNAQGHVTGYTTTAVTLPSEQNVTHNLSVGNNHTITLSGPNDVTSGVALVAGNSITLADNAADGQITINHAAYDTTITPTKDTESNGLLTHGGTFTVVTAVARDTTGHVSGYTTKEFTMPADNNTTYELSGKATVSDAGVATISTVLTADGATNAGSVQANIQSSSLKVSAPAGTTNTIAIDLEWGSF